MSVYEKSYRLLSSDVDAQQRLRLSRLFTFLQEASIAHTTALGMGREKTLDKGLLWIVTLQQVKAHSCFVGFGTIHVDMENLMEEVEHIPQMGLKGIKIHPDCQHFNIDDPRLFPVYEAVQGKMPMMIHLGDEQYDYSHPARLRHVLDLFPKLQVCAAHFGGHTMYETAKEYLSDTNCIMDISSTLMFLDKKTAEGYVNHYGAERLAFGTDYPVWDPVQEVQRLQALNLTDDQKEQIAWKTAARFLNL